MFGVVATASNAAGKVTAGESANAMSSPTTKKRATSRAEMQRVITSTPCFRLYDEIPQQSMALFDLEGLVMKRMELLAYIDSIRNSPTLTGSADLIERVQKALREERLEAHALTGKDSVKYAQQQATPVELSTGKDTDHGLAYAFTPQDDATAHMCCRLVFCQSDAWREWFIRNEEVILRARVSGMMEIPGYRSELFSAVQLPVKELTEEILERLPAGSRQWLESKVLRAKGGSGTAGSADLKTACCMVPLSHALKAVRRRECICFGGMAIVPMESVVDSYFAEFRRRLTRGLQDAHFTRQRVLANPDPSSALTNTMVMLDAFFARFIVDPADSLKPVSAGGVTAADIPRLADTYFPLCMKRQDEFLRRERHVKHHGRWQYGLFLKGIGLSVEDALSLFGTLLTLKAPKDFPKSSYAYNIRHMYGKEGKRTSYSSLTCSSIINLPPNIDRHDCHGCPFHYKDEGQLRQQLQQPRTNPRGSTVRLAPNDIEDIVADAKGRHYTRACFKYFTAANSAVQVKRDTLFRSPLEYYMTGMSAWDAAMAEAEATKNQQDDTTPTGKRDREHVAPSSTRTKFQPSAEKGGAAASA